MSFNLFGPATKCDIRVGYIDPDLGYVKEVSIYDANEYAFKNPGTTFIFETRDAIRYLNINEVNNLTPNDLLPKKNAVNSCDGIVGLSPSDSDIKLSDGTVVPVQNRKGTYKTYVKLSGGGGTGAVANPVFGSDGSLLAVDVIRGGFGYQYPPIVKIIDENKRGSGAVIRSVLGERPPTIEYFDQEDDFEFYDFSRCTEELEGYGTRFGVNGEVLGGWDPTLYATLAKDPIKVEIKEYQEYLAQGISPFWSTRKENPLAVTFRDRKTNLVFPVSDLKYKEKLRQEGKPVPSGWGPWMNTYAVSPVPPQWNSDVPGSDYAGGVATMTWEEEFPYDGVYTFKAMADNIAVIYIDNTPILETSNFIGGPTKRVDKNLKAGVHEIKIDLTNIPQLRKKKINKPQAVSVGEEILVSYRGMSKGAGIRRSSDTLVQIDDDIKPKFDENARFEILESTCNARFSDDGKKILYSGSGDITIKFKYDDDPKISGLAVSDIEAGGTVWERDRAGFSTRRYPIEIANRGSLGRGDNAAVKSVSKKKIKFTDSRSQDDTDAEFKILPGSPGVTAEFKGSNDDNLELVVRGSGDLTLQLKWDDDPKKNGEAVGNIKVAGEVWKQRAFKDKKGDVTKTIKVSGGKGILGSGVYKEKGEVTKTISVKGSSKQNTPVKPTKVPENSSIIKQGFSGEVFNTVSAMGAANRRLWRTNVYGRGGFLGEYGVCPFDTKQNLADNPYPGTHIITWPKVEIPQDGNYDIEIEVDDRVKLTLANEVIEKNGFVGDSDKGTGKSTYTKFFRKGTYPLTAELYQKPGGRFSFQQGAAVATKSGGISARFTQDGGETFLLVEGSGSAKIDFSLRTGDSTAYGLALTEVSVGNANLKRTRKAIIKSYHPDGRSRGKTGRELVGYSYTRKETITGSGTFTAGQRYKVVRKGAASDAPSPRAEGLSVFFNDSSNDSFDAELKINRVHSPQPAAVKGVNPMALAVKISGKPDEYIVSPVTWKDNPMGVALTIDSPLPPIPEEPIPPQEGRCPNNPFWTTRFTGGKEKWWPVNVGPRWSDFMNRYAISPIAPRSERTTDGGGIPYFNTWNLDIPYNGYFGIKGTCDNFGSILIDGQEVYKLAGFKNSSPPIEKVYLSQGQHEISVKVENQKTTFYRQIEKTVFDTKDWGKPLADAPEEEVQFYTTSSAKFANSVELVGKFKVSKDYDGAQIKDTRNVKIKPGQVYDVIFRSNAKGSPPKSRPGTRSYPITVAKRGSLGRGDNAAVKSVSKKKIKFTDSKRQDDTDAEFIILDSPGVTAEFKGSNDDNLELVVKGDGNVVLQLKWDDSPRSNGEAVGNIKVGGEVWKQRAFKSKKGDVTKTIRVSGGGGSGSQPNPNIRLRRKGETVVEMEEHTDNDYTDIIIRSNKGRFYGLNGNRAKFVLGSPAQNPTTPKEIAGVKYSGPDITKYTNPGWGSFMNMRGIALYKPPRDEENPIQGVFNYTWSGVNLDATGRYAIRLQADVNANQTTQRTKLYIDDTLVAESNQFRGGDPVPVYVNLPEGKVTLRIEETVNRNEENIFDINPFGFGLQLTKVIDVPNGSKSWIQNPVGVSAILIPPPCPKTVEGKGVVTEIIVDEPGNGYPQPPGDGYPVILRLAKIIPTSPGIGYKPTDPIFIEGFPDVPIEIETGPFGSVTEVIIPPPDAPATGTGTNRPLIGFTEYPNITLPSDTGIGFRGRPVFEPIIVPEDVFENVIQVTDLVGLKQTGYVNGKPYYGSVYSENGQLFAGIYATIGDPIPVYATLQESIDAEVVTRPSAILRQGTDVTNADPRLNIPGTPDNLV
jgi:hypothetical protein